MAKQNTARTRTSNPKPSSKRKLEVVPDAAPQQNPQSRGKAKATTEANPKRRRRRRRNSSRRKNMSTGGKIAVGVAIALVAVPVVVLAVGAIVVGKIASKAIDDFPTSPTFPTQPVPVYPVYPQGQPRPSITPIHATVHT
jgi:hypothetical protein